MQTTTDRATECQTPVKHAPLASVIDLFCGVGALSHGFLLEGYSITCGYDIDERCRYPFESNNDAPFLRADVAAINATELAAEFHKSLPRVLVGCAPCQPFSLYSQGRDDPKWQLLEDFGRLAVSVEPDVLSMENVPQLLRFKGGAAFDGFVNTLTDGGYAVRWMIAECPEFGVPQARSRLVLIASKHGEPELPQPTHLPHEYVTVYDAIGHMPELEAGGVDHEDALHRASRISPLNLRRIRSSTPGGTWRDWDESLITACHQRDTGKGYGSVYGRMRWDKPAPTITTQFYGFGNGRFGHPDQDRALSLREGAILQTFPQNYTFVRQGDSVTFKELGRMIGNAVPITLARAIAKAITRHLETVT